MPSGTETASPSMVSVTVRRCGALGRAADRHQGSAVLTMPRASAEEAEALDRRLDRRVRGLAEAADRGVAHRLADVVEQRQLVASRRAGDPDAIRCSASSWRTVPTRHGTHWPHDSSRKNAAMRSTMSRRSTVSSNTSTTPEPSVVFAARASSW